MKLILYSVFLALILSLSITAPASAQVRQDSSTTANSPRKNSDSANHINVNYFGWLGLFGLFGLRRRSSAGMGTVRAMNP